MLGEPLPADNALRVAIYAVHGSRTQQLYACPWTSIGNHTLVSLTTRRGLRARVQAEDIDAEQGLVFSIARDVSAASFASPAVAAPALSLAGAGGGSAAGVRAAPLISSQYTASSRASMGGGADASLSLGAALREAAAGTPHGGARRASGVGSIAGTGGLR